MLEDARPMKYMKEQLDYIHISDLYVSEDVSDFLSKKRDIFITN